MRSPLRPAAGRSQPAIRGAVSGPSQRSGPVSGRRSGPRSAVPGGDPDRGQRSSGPGPAPRAAHRPGTGFAFAAVHGPAASGQAGQDAFSGMMLAFSGRKHTGEKDALATAAGGFLPSTSQAAATDPPASLPSPSVPSPRGSPDWQLRGAGQKMAITAKRWQSACAPPGGGQPVHNFSASITPEKAPCPPWP